MKKSSIIIVVLVVIILAFLIFRKDKGSDTITPSPETPAEETPILENETPITETPAPTPAPQTSYSYTNDEFDFAVNLPGLVATRKADTPDYVKAIFTFGVGDQSDIEEQKRIPNTMVVYIWQDQAEFAAMSATGTKLSDETVNGVNYSVTSFTNEDMTSYRYSVEKNGYIYDIGVSDRQKMKEFHFI